MRTNKRLSILIITPFALWMYIICISNIIMQELSGAPYAAGIITYVSAFIIFLCYYWLLLKDIKKMEDSTKYLKWTCFCLIVGISVFIVTGCNVLLKQKEYLHIEPVTYITTKNKTYTEVITFYP